MSQDDPAPGEGSAAQLSGEEKSHVSAKQPARAAVLHEIIRVQGEAELSRSAAALAWSALAAGLSMGFSTLFRGVFQAQVPEGSAQHLLGSFGYSIGFLIVILARQQLFTENTVTAVLPFMTRPSPGNGLRLLLDVATVPLLKGKRVVVVDDVVASGSSLKGSLELVRKTGAEVVGIGVILTEAGDWQAVLGDDAELVHGLAHIPQFTIADGADWQPIPGT